ncbi:DUF3800 domain-containing protein [Pedobacter nyackensis]|uniref:DUF3800 domain-containing protein n=1 Tax=Pedobacter nyackensis TaxID=475255 RepID=UPI00292F1A39|nr:DUF3800 domain-containing protein [Pedobacter nyackensis]
MKRLYFDESGFTGYNHLDREQPIFALASHDLNEELAQSIMKRSFPNYKGEEYKFSSLWKSSKPQFLGLAKNLKPFTNGIRFWIIDKHFAVLVKMVDFLIEPATTASGYNFLAGGFGRKLANQIYYNFQSNATPGMLDELLNQYQFFSRNPSKETLATFLTNIEHLYNKQSLAVKHHLALMVEGVRNFEHFNNLDTFKSTNDLQFTAMLAMIVDWRKATSEDFTVIHDASSNFLRQRQLWDQITSHDVISQDFPLGDGSTVAYPLRVLNTKSVNSKDSYGVQLSDLLAGYASKHFDLTRPKEERETLDGMVTAGLYGSNFNSIRPAKDFPSGAPSKLTGPDAVDLLINIMKKN